MPEHNARHPNSCDCPECEAVIRMQMEERIKEMRRLQDAIP